MATLAQRTEAVEERVDGLETILARFMARTDESIARTKESIVRRLAPRMRGRSWSFCGTASSH